MAYLSREGKTWKHLIDKEGNAFTSFEHYGKERFGYESTHLYRLCTAYEVQKSLNFSPIGEKEIPERQLRELGKIKDTELRNEVYEQVKTEHENEQLIVGALRLKGQK